MICGRLFQALQTPHIFFPTKDMGWLWRLRFEVSSLKSPCTMLRTLLLPRDGVGMPVQPFHRTVLWFCPSLVYPRDFPGCILICDRLIRATAVALQTWHDERLISVVLGAFDRPSSERETARHSERGTSRSEVRIIWVRRTVISGFCKCYVLFPNNAFH